MLDAVARARAAGVKTGLISNSWGLGIYDRLESTELFDAAVISGEVGLHKPQPEIYLLACERLAIEPGEAVFVDDLRENCAGAEAVGMTALLHREPAETVARARGAVRARAQHRPRLSAGATRIGQGARPRRRCARRARPRKRRRRSLSTSGWR